MRINPLDVKAATDHSLVGRVPPAEPTNRYAGESGVCGPVVP